MSITGCAFSLHYRLLVTGSVDTEGTLNHVNFSITNLQIFEIAVVIIPLIVNG